MWLREHLDDICSDLSVFHRIDDFTELDGPTLWKLAWRLPAYQGRMALVVEELQSAEQGTTSQPAAIGPVGAGHAPALNATPEVLLGHPAVAASGAYGPVFSYTQVAAD
jgi:hypothetical protein